MAKPGSAQPKAPKARPKFAAPKPWPPKVPLGELEATWGGPRWSRSRWFGKRGIGLNVDQGGGEGFLGFSWRGGGS